MMKRIFALIAVISLGSAVQACGPAGGDDDVVNVDVAGDISTDVQRDSTIVPDESGIDVRPSDIVDLIDPMDVLTDGVNADTGVEDVVLECPGNSGCPCDDGSECYSSFCVETSGGKVCASGCAGEASCPRGWKCSQVSVAGDTTFICVDPFSRICRPCVQDSECQPSIGAGSDVYDCVSYGPDGSFCANGCTNDDGCPPDYNCVTNPSGAGMRCLPTGGTCECTELYIEQGYLSQCYIENDIGKCMGTRTCDGLCNAMTPKVERCNAIDDDCNGQTDEGVAGTECPITTEFGTCQGTWLCNSGTGVCSGRSPTAETCNAQDDNCNGTTDENASNCVTYYRDNDHDNFGQVADWRCLCQAVENYTATAPGDCTDNDSNVYPGILEACNEKDDNCNGETDEIGAINCIDFYKDVDQDGFGLNADKRCLCAASGQYSAVFAGDCNDALPAVNPGADEACNGKDDDCDSKTDEEGATNCAEWYKDVDADTFGDVSNHKCLCAATTEYKVSIGFDCNDSNAFVNPGILEECNAIDDNCDGRTDEEGADGCDSYYYDNDGDSYGVGTAKCYCGGTGKYTALLNADCNDLDGTANPGADEVCNTKDDNCNGSSDEPGALGCTPYFLDTDRDTYGDSNQWACLCAQQGDFRATRGGDCNDGDEFINPGRTEVCNGKDDDCDTFADEDNATNCVDYYMDADRDTYGDVTKRRCMCLSIPGTYDATTANDCCDADANTYPGQVTYFSSPNGCSKYDYNCSGSDEKQWTTTGGGCEGWAVGNGCDVEPGWVGSSIPACGVSAQWVYSGCGYTLIPVDCKDPTSRTQVQACR
jgi:hypothetical protein